jgi:succinate dehydrogenase / fumarate reductase cytochrome b subunit
MATSTLSTGLIKSSIGKKYLMAISGLFLCTFLIVHLIGNLQLFKDDGGRAFNEYTYFMTHNPLIKIVAYVNYALILLHVIDGFLLTFANRKARPVNYSYSNPSKNSIWASRNMGILGTIILVFIVVHMGDFWFEMKFGTVPTVTYDGVEYKDLYVEVTEAFQTGWYVALYVVSMIAIGFHLFHGFQSAFQTVGLNHHKYTPIIRFVGTTIFAILVPAAFASLPIYFYFFNA